MNRNNLPEIKMIKLFFILLITNGCLSEEDRTNPLLQEAANDVKDPTFHKIVPLDGENMIQATDYVIENLTEYRHNESDYIDRFCWKLIIKLII